MAELTLEDLAEVAGVAAYQRVELTPRARWGRAWPRLCYKRRMQLPVSGSSRVPARSLSAADAEQIFCAPGADDLSTAILSITPTALISLTVAGQGGGLSVNRCGKARR
jgi:hypothetical protein